MTEEERDGIDGQAWSLDIDGKPVAVPRDPDALQTLRSAAIEVMARKQYALRSCWQCNGAHAHFLSGEWGDWVLRCFGCWRIYYNGVDLTECDDKPESVKAD